MSNSRLDVYLHFVWATKDREPTIPETCEADLYNVIKAEVKRLHCETLAVNGMPDHIHLLLRYGRSTSLGRLMNQVKGVSSAFMNDHLFPNRKIFSLAVGVWRFQY